MPAKKIEQRLPKPVVVSGRLVVGIDPDLVKSGVAEVYDGKVMDMKALSFPDLLDWAVGKVFVGALFVVEDVEADATTYHRSGTNGRQHARIAQNVGQVKGVARVLVECLESMGADVVQVKPLRGPIKKAKADRVYFNRVTGWAGSSNEDKRDAALLALFGVGRK